MDKSQHSKLTQVFEQAAEQEAQAHPLQEQLWQNIVQELSTPPLEEPSERLQKAFEEQEVPALPPVDLWGNIAEGLDQNKIKESFEEQTIPAAPAAVWEDIEQQLEIETVWKRIHKALDKRTSWLYWREKAVQGSLVLLVLLWLRGCDWGEQPPPQVVVNPVALATDYNTSTNKNSSVITSKEKEEKGTNKTIVNTATTALPSTNKKALSIAPTISKTIALSATASTKVAGPTNVTKTSTNNIGPIVPPVPPMATTIVVNKDVIKPFEWQDLPAAKEQPTRTGEKGTKQTVIVDLAQGNKEGTAGDLKEKNTLDNTPTLVPANLNEEPFNPSKKATSNNTNRLINAPLLPLQNEAIETAKVPTLPVPKAVKDPSIIALEAIELQRVQQKKQQQTQIEFGMQVRVKGTMLLGNMTTEAMEHSSMVKTRVMPTVGVGANLAWYFTRNDALIASLYPMANSHQYFGGYTEEGRYYHKEIKLSYFDAELAYQRTLFHYSDFGILPSSVYARVSYGFGYLNKGETVLNGMAIDETAVYNNTNHSLGLALGNTHRIKRWVIDYGLYGQVGLSTIHRQQPTDYRHLLGVGAYLGLRYSL
ncbi:MAG: hypothetical protein ACRBFS_05355 [Aureispira sp.]